MIVTLILFILILGTIVLVHETGHFLLAKLNGVHVFEFSIGMGPKAYQKIAKDGTKYSIRWIPIGGYVSLAGEELEDAKDEKLKGKTLQDKKVWQRFSVMVMGVCFNFLFAFVILLVSALIFGSQDLTPTITKVETGYPAFEAGLTPNDKILEINGHKITYLDDVSLYFAIENLDKPLDIKVLKENDEIRNYSILPNKITDDEGTPTYQIGITLTAKQRHGFFAPIIYAFQKECALFKQMFVVLGNLVTGKVSFNQLGGPVGIFSVVGQMKNEGVNALLYLVALLSINVGVINILPFPAFDGGRIALLVVEKIKGSPVNPKVENAINGVGFILLMILMVFVTINDILRLI